MPFTIRPAVPADAAAFLELRNALHAETTFMLYEPDEFKSTVEDEAALIERFNSHGRSLILVAVADGAEGDALAGMLIARGGGVIRRHHCAHLALGVRREHWSRGIATAMMNECVAWSERIGLKLLELTVHATNYRALPIYLRCGFVVDGLRRASFLIDGEFVDEYMMSRISRG